MTNVTVSIKAADVLASAVHLCPHSERRHSWRLTGHLPISACILGTPEELKAIGERLIALAKEHGAA